MPTRHTAKLILAAITASACTALAGPLTPPPGPPSSTNKTLQQVEPRTPISTGGVTISIGDPTSYYLTNDINTTGTAIGISAAATIDLNGFIINQIGVNNVAGITIGDVPSGVVVIRNGTIRNFRGRGVSSTFANTRVILENVHIENCGDDGAFIRGDADIVNSTAHANGGSGFRVDGTARVSGLRATENVVTGIVVEAGVVTESIARDNGSNGFSLGGIVIDAGSVIAVNCFAKNNDSRGFFATDPVTLVNCHSAENGINGFQLDNDASLEGCIARQNGNVGILAGQSATLSRCIASENATNGIRGSSDTVIDSCSVTDNVTGIVAGTGGLVIRCFAAGNSTNYDMTSADHGAIITPAGAFTSTNAFANIAY